MSCVLIAAVVFAAACGSDDTAESTSTQAALSSSTTSPAAVTTGSITTSPSATEPLTQQLYSTAPGEYVTGSTGFRDAGWIYRFEADFEPGMISAEKVIANSPPGSAQIAINVVQRDSVFYFTGDTPGRSTPPDEPVRIALLYPVPTAGAPRLSADVCGYGLGVDQEILLESGGWLTDDTSWWICTVWTDDEGAATTIGGREGYGWSGGSGTSGDEEEVAVDALVSGLNAAGPPFFMVQFVDSCYALYAPDGSVSFVQNQSENGCRVGLRP